MLTRVSARDADPAGMDGRVTIDDVRSCRRSRRAPAEGADAALRRAACVAVTRMARRAASAGVARGSHRRS